MVAGRERLSKILDMLVAFDRVQRSLAQQAIVELRQIPELMARQRRKQVVERIRQTLAGPPRVLEPPPEALVREDRER